MSWCHDNKVLYVNTSVEEWDPYADIDKKTPLEKSLYYRHMILRKMTAGGSTSTTAVVDHGANPGLISHFTKKGIVDIARKVIRDKAVTKKEEKILESLIHHGRFANLAMELGIKVIHVSEGDTQITNRPKEVDEFVGTWSIEGLREEGVAPSSLRPSM